MSERSEGRKHTEIEVNESQREEKFHNDMTNAFRKTHS